MDPTNIDCVKIWTYDPPTFLKAKLVGFLTKIIHNTYTYYTTTDPRLQVRQVKQKEKVGGALR